MSQIPHFVLQCILQSAQEHSLDHPVPHYWTTLYPTSGPPCTPLLYHPVPHYWTTLYPTSGSPCTSPLDHPVPHLWTTLYHPSPPYRRFSAWGQERRWQHHIFPRPPPAAPLQPHPALVLHLLCRRHHLSSACCRSSSGCSQGEDE